MPKKEPKVPRTSKNPKTPMMGQTLLLRTAACEEQQYLNAVWLYKDTSMYMKRALLLMVVLLTACSEPKAQTEEYTVALPSGVDPQNPFATPESTILVLESEIQKYNVGPYLNRTYFSPYVREVFNSRGSSVEEFQAAWADAIIYEIPQAELDTIEFTGKEVINDTSVSLAYTIRYKPDKDGNPVASKEDETYFVKFDDGWYIDVEPEFIKARMVPPKPLPVPTIPEGTKDCGTYVQTWSAEKNDTPWNCFMEAYAQCTPAKMTSSLHTTEGDPIASTRWTEQGQNGCEIHVYVDSKDNWGFYGQAYYVCTGDVYVKDADSWKQVTKGTCEDQPGYAPYISADDV
jgi:hypothetical protein